MPAIFLRHAVKMGECAGLNRRIQGRKGSPDEIRLRGEEIIPKILKRVGWLGHNASGLYSIFDQDHFDIVDKEYLRLVNAPVGLGLK
jgi:hypothetical protein